MVKPTRASFSQPTSASVAGIYFVSLRRGSSVAMHFFCNCYDVAVPILIRVFMSKFEAQRCLIPNAVFLFFATCIGFE